MKKILLLLFTILSFSSYAQISKMGGMASRVNDSSAYVTNAAVIQAHADGYHDIWLSNASNLFWVWNGSAYVNWNPSGGNFWKNSGTTNITNANIVAAGGESFDIGSVGTNTDSKITFNGAGGATSIEADNLINLGVFDGTTTSNVQVTPGAFQLFDSELILDGVSGTSGQVPTSQGAGLPTVWTTPSGGSGTVTSVGLTAGTTGTDVNISGSPVTTSGSLNINIPSASGTARGLVTTGAQTFAGLKTFSTPPVIASTNPASIQFGSATGQLTGNIFFTYNPSTSKFLVNRSSSAVTNSYAEFSGDFAVNGDQNISYTNNGTGNASKASLRLFTGSATTTTDGLYLSLGGPSHTSAADLGTLWNYEGDLEMGGVGDINLRPTGDLQINGSPGTSGQVLQSNGAGTPPTWETVSGGGFVSPTALTDGASISITSTNNTLTTTQSAITFSDGWTGNYSGVSIIFNQTSATWTFPAGALCVVEGVASGNNTAAVTGTSGDKIEISIRDIDGTNYRVAIKNFGQ